MNLNQKPRPCGCKGCRSCLICENEYGVPYKTFELSEEKSYVYCPECNVCYRGWNLDLYKTHPQHTGTSVEYSGVYIKSDFLTVDEENKLIKCIDDIPWILSQSGRRKQNYGPKCNFRKRKLTVGNFEGFPAFSKFVQDKFGSVPILKGFKTIEQCSLEYDPATGASIDPHIDDCWVWGERIVTVNLLSDTVLTMTRNEKHLKYNLDCVKEYPSVLNDVGDYNNTNKSYNINKDSLSDGVIIRIPMPRRSLLVLYGSARYQWEHQVLREDIHERRICIAYREFTPPYLPNGNKYNEGKPVLDNAETFL